MALTRRYHPARRVVAGFAALVLVSLLSFTPAAADPTSPSDDDVRTAQANESDLAVQAAVAEVELIDLAEVFDSTWEAAKSAGEDYLQALDAVDKAKSVADQAQQRLATALEKAEASRKVLAGVAMEQFRNGGSMRALEAVLTADGITEVIERTNSLEIANSIADSAVQQFKADSLIADTMQIRAETALATAEDAALAADAALLAANNLQSDAETAVAQGQVRRTELITTLAAARNTTIEAETQRQDALEQARRERAEIEAQANREDPQPLPPASLMPGSGPVASLPTPQGTSDPQPTSVPKPTSAPTQPVAPNPAPTTAAPLPQPTATRPPAPTPNPEPAVTPTPTPRPTTPAPEPTQPPKPKPTPPVTGGGGVAVGSAAQGVRAVAWAKTKIGSPYGWGSTGPSTYDCSGLTYMAWNAQGVNITRTSRSQYSHVKKISFAQMRPGDLIFYGSNQANAQSITHVAMYAGNNQMVEARRPGVPLSVTPVRYAGTMAFAGRP